MDIRVVRVWEKRCLVEILDGAISFRVGFLPYYNGAGYYLKFPDNMDVSPVIRDEIEKQIKTEIGENENAERSEVLS